MDKRTFNKTMTSLCVKTKGRPWLSLAKLAGVDNKTKNQLIAYIVRRRDPVIAAMINPETDQSWLASSGYLYSFKNADYEFIGLCDHYVAHQETTKRIAGG
jgi:hypothetical protein